MIQRGLRSLFLLLVVAGAFSCAGPGRDTAPVDVSGLIADAQYDEAAAVIEASLRRDPRDPDLLYNLAVIERLRGNLDEARNAANKAQSNGANDPLLKLLLAELHLEYGEADTALDLYQAFDNETRKIPRAQALMGLILSQLHKWDEAVAAFNAALQLGDESPATRAALAFAMLKSGEVEMAKQRLAEAEQGNPQDVDTQRQIAECYIALGDAQRAKEIALPLVSQRGEDARLWSLIGRAEMLLLRFNESESAFTRAVVAPNATPWTQVEYAMMLFAAEREDESLKKAVEAETLLRDSGQAVHNPSLYNLLATLYARNGQWLLAKKYLDQSFQLDVNQPKVRELLNRINNPATPTPPPAVAPQQQVEP